MGRVGVLSFGAAIALCASSACAGDYRASAPYLTIRCNEHAVRDRIAADFNARYWPMTLVGMRRLRTAKWNSWPQALIPRRFCSGQVLASDRQPRPIYYSIIEDGSSYRVEWCVVGLDRDWAYNPHCRLARP